MADNKTERLPAAFAGVTGALIGGWWVASVANVLPDALKPVQQAPSHVVAELVLAVALLSGSWLALRRRASARFVLTAALGALLYAIVNVMTDYSHDAVMEAVLSASAVLALASLAVLASPRR